MPRYNLGLVRPKVPAAWAARWACTTWTPDVRIVRDPVAPYGSVGITPEALFDLFSTARSAPANTYYVNVATGNDANLGTSGSKLKSIHAAVTLANASGQPAKIIVTAGDYPYANGFSASAGTVLPTVDVWYEAVGGRVTVGSWNDFTAMTTDGTHTNTYSATVSNVNRVIDRLSTRDGRLVELTNVATAAICNRTPNSWTLVAGTLYINRGDGAAVTNTNTRYYRSTVANLKVTANVNIGLGNSDAISSWELEAGSSVACLDYAPTTLAGAFKIVLGHRVSFLMAGGVAETGAGGVKIDNLHGVAAFFECAGDANATDGFNARRSSVTGAKGHLVTVNCSGFDNGRGSGQSCNGWTLHHDFLGVDVGGVYDRNRGGTIRCIDDSMTWCVGTVVRGDQGDRAQGGTIGSTAFRVDGNAQMYIDSPVIDQRAGAISFNAATASTSAIYVRGAIPARSTLTGAGIVGTY